MKTVMKAFSWKCLWSLSICLLVATNAFRHVSLRHQSKGSTKPFILSLTSKDSDVTQTICMVIDEEADRFREEATAIANKLGITLVSTLDSESTDTISFTHALRLVTYECNDNETFALGIDLIEADNSKKKKKKKPKKLSPPFYCDLCPPANSKAGRRASGNSGTSDLLIKAVAPAKCPGGAVVWDLTAGLGQDSLILAKNGARQVVMVERNPIVAALLEDAMRRLALQHESPLRFAMGEAREVLERENPTDCDVVYLDPMFPPRQKQSAVKKGMSILHGLLETHVANGHEESRLAEEQKLLEASLQVAKLRVVVKRPAKAPLLGDGTTKPSHALTGSVNRWDVYVTKQSSE